MCVYIYMYIHIYFFRYVDLALQQEGVQGHDGGADPPWTLTIYLCFARSTTG